MWLMTQRAMAAGTSASGRDTSAALVDGYRPDNMDQG